MIHMHLVSPFLMSPLASMVGDFGTGQAAQNILKGTFIYPPDLDKHTWFLSRHCNLLPRWHASLNCLLSYNWKIFIAHWKHTKEWTSSSPLGLHFGHYKSATYSTLIAHLHARFTQLIFMSSLLISCFQAGLQVILEKSWVIYLLTTWE